MTFDRRTVRLTASAKKDVRDTISYYQNARHGLGSEFVERLLAAISQIEKHPETFAVLYKGIRRAGLQQFPYGVFFRERKDLVEVIAVIGLRRDPRTWQRRV